MKKKRGRSERKPSFLLWFATNFLVGLALSACNTARPWARVEHRKAHEVESKWGVQTERLRFYGVATTRVGRGGSTTYGAGVEVILK